MLRRRHPAKDEAFVSAGRGQEEVEVDRQNRDRERYVHQTFDQQAEVVEVK